MEFLDLATRLTPYLSIIPVRSAGRAMAVYVPLVLLNRGLALVRLLLVARLLNEPGKPVYGRFQQALEIITWLSALAMLGLPHIAERYVSHFEKHGQLRAFLRRQAGQILAIAGGLGAVVIAASYWAGPWVFGASIPGRQAMLLLALAALNAVVLGLYQWLAAVLRGLRAYGASAGFETAAAVLFVAFSGMAALAGSAAWLLVAYALSNLLPLLWYGLQTRRFLQQDQQNAPLPTEAAHAAKLGAFGRWSFVRLLLYTTFGLISINSVAKLLHGTGDPGERTADYAMAYRIAQLLSFAAVTLWSSAYAIAARAWAHGQRKRALVTFLRIGQLGGVLLLAVAVAVLWGRHLLIPLMPASYAPTLLNLLPLLLALFYWHGLLAFFASLGDLREKPALGAALWGGTVVLQSVLIGMYRAAGLDPKWLVAIASTVAVGVMVLIGPLPGVWLTKHPLRTLRAQWPWAALLLMPLLWFVPRVSPDISGPISWMVLVALLMLRGRLLRDRDRRRLRAKLARFLPPQKSTG